MKEGNFEALSRCFNLMWLRSFPTKLMAGSITYGQIYSVRITRSPPWSGRIEQFRKARLSSVQNGCVFELFAPLFERSLYSESSESWIHFVTLLSRSLLPAIVETMLTASFELPLVEVWPIAAASKIKFRGSHVKPCYFLDDTFSTLFYVSSFLLPYRNQCSNLTKKCIGQFG